MTTTFLQIAHFGEIIEQLSFSTWVSESKSLLAYPTILWIHVMGMGVVAGIASFISLRLLGVSPKIPLKPLERLYPLIWTGFWVNAATGTALLMASASKRLVDPVFFTKLGFVFIGVAVLQRTRTKVFQGLRPNGEVPESAKPLAWAALTCWLGAIIAGRLLAYL
jgi:hypothetical protein